jgi:malate dehydrogenase (quinone)
VKSFDIIIVGGGVSGTALLYVLSRFSSIKNIALLEKHASLGSVNSKATQNSQTLHFGDIETNYTLEKSVKVKKYADILKNYLDENEEKHKGIFKVYPKMVIAVGHAEVEELSHRYEEFKKLFPRLKRLDRDAIADIEPSVIAGRDPGIPILALYSDEGYTVDYGRLSKAFAKDAERDGIHVLENTKVSAIHRDNEYYVYTNNGLFKAPVVIVTAGAHSLMMAHPLGYGKEYGILSVAGSFYHTPKILNGKVYTMQKKKLPFAAVHGDPEVHDAHITRFGPTAKPIFMLERYQYGSVWEYFKTLGIGWKQIATIAKITNDSIIFPYILKNFFYDWPIIGKRLFLKEARKVVPSLKAGQLRYAKRYGGNRPQIINLDKKTMDTGEAKIIGDNIIFNITPSPGASTCLGNAYEEAQMIMGFFAAMGRREIFYREKFEKAYIKNHDR